MADRAATLDLARLVAEHHESLYRYAYRLSGSAADAEDLVQQAFLIAQQKLDQVRCDDAVRSWLYTVLRNCYLKSRRLRLPLPATNCEIDLGAVPAEVGQQLFDSGELQAALDALSEEFKIVVLMFYYEQRSYREIAEALEMPIGTVMSRLARAKAQLRKLLDADDRSPERTMPASATLRSPSAAWPAR